MNKLHGHIHALEVSGNLTIVEVAVTSELFLKAIVIDTPQTADYLQKGHKVSLVFKETEVIIGIGEQSNVSLQNQLPATILGIEKGKLLSKIKLSTTAGALTSIISTAAVMKLNLAVSSEVVAMVKLNEVMLRRL
ncbi:molybdopterin-binding protein [Leeuwenhoekiella sp. MAR_2009_132]|uniref:TOBE domain-containing protein n=1 Tax=Leeuwenhoekiella sp. MAR_2009_132 TaxID=1392489 RepID=UPI00068FF844|nr:TOBE domain-containing protein [Leeuwenhoekiella sp. MAR_2009_132]